MRAFLFTGGFPSRNSGEVVTLRRAGTTNPLAAIFFSPSGPAIYRTTSQAPFLFLEELKTPYPDPPLEKPFFPSGPLGNMAISQSNVLMSRNSGVCQRPEKNIAA